MRTSATGAEAGFTLVELMVVVVILGLMASVAVMAAGPGRPSLSAEAERFAARLVHAQQEAVLTNRPVGVAVTAEGYAFRTRTAAGWAELRDGPFEPRRWSDGVVASTDEGAKAQLNFESTGGAEPLTVTLTRQSQRMLVTIDASGNVRVDAAA